MNACIPTYLLSSSTRSPIVVALTLWSFARKVLCGTFLILLPSSVAAAAQHLPTIQGIRTISLADETRVVISLSAPIAYELIADPSASPSRLYIRFSPASLAPGARTTAKVDDGLLKEVRTGLVADSIIRVSLEVERLGTYRATAFRSPDQVVIQLRKQPEIRIAARPPVRPRSGEATPPSLKDSGGSQTILTLPLSAPPLPSPPQPSKPVERQAAIIPPLSAPPLPSLPQPSKPVERQAAIIPPHPTPTLLRPQIQEQPTEPSVPNLRYRIMLDPGHGGSDPGAQGVNGLQEKTVVLAVSKRLAQKLRTRLGADVLLTRTEDVFIPLPERTARANAAKADLFISIHANASPNPETHGIETYYLNNTEDRATIRLAKLENGIRAKQQLPQREVSLSYILSDLIQTGKEEESVALAQSVQTALVNQARTTVPLAHDLGVKKGPFYVLVGAHMPCVLVELAFLTHADEVQRLGSATYQETLAEGLFHGIADFLRTGLSAKNL